jgi:hypothetical protein
VWGDGSIYIGGYKDGCRTEGKKYQLQQDGTHTLFHVKYDGTWRNTEIEKKEISSGHKMV